MKFFKAVNEIYTSYTPIRMSKSTANEFVVEYQVDDVHYRFVAVNALGDWSIFFDAQLNVNTAKPSAASLATNPSIVLSNYLKCLGIFFTQNSPDTFAFCTNNDSVRRGVFNNIIRKVISMTDKQYRYVGRLTKDYTHRFIFAKVEK